MLDQLAAEDPRLRVLHLAENQGKAVALRMGAIAARSEYLVCIDGDALLAPNTCAYLVAPMLDNARLGAVNRQPAHPHPFYPGGAGSRSASFSSIIGLIKRTQRVFGRIFTVSGVIVAFRRTALHRVGYWSPDMITEDIDISWKLQLDHWSIFYEPRALCWILMPENPARPVAANGCAGPRAAPRCCSRISVASGNTATATCGRLLFEYCLSTGWAFTFLLSVIFLGRWQIRGNAGGHRGRPPHAAGLHRVVAGGGVPAAVRGEHPD
ncbi:glycosyltransferase [Pseudomonas viciae]|uniref:glycosyltransferase n=1 Tax=Pseudomonas viciae TaxID=2505979 RepID=UPI0022345FAB|nr:glycosyltransferase [Pseudomonas viciae]